jgi:hypothetical protein
MSQKSPYATVGNDILGRLEAIGARIEAVSRRAGALLGTPEERREKNLTEDDPVQHLEQIESNLEALEERLKKMEAQMREKESPPETFGTSSQFSTGPHFPGIG